jgi:hypothetical protein
MNAAPGMNAPELFEQYRRLSEEELEQLLREFDDLLEPAQACLIAELQTRGQTDKTISATIEAGRKVRLPLTLTDGFDPDLTKKIGSVSSFHGIGRFFSEKRTVLSMKHLHLKNLTLPYGGSFFGFHSFLQAPSESGESKRRDLLLPPHLLWYSAYHFCGFKTSSY